MEEPNEKSKMGIATFERRRYPRFLLDLPIEYKRADSSKHQEGRAGNASRSGLLVYLPEPVEIGQHLQVKLFFTHGRELFTLNALSEVVWVNTYFGKEGDYQCGLRFMETGDDDLRKLEEFLDKLARSQ
jgi:hypothetical protein